MAGSQQHLGVGHPPRHDVGSVEEAQPRTGRRRCLELARERALPDHHKVELQSLRTAGIHDVHCPHRVLVAVEVTDEEGVGHVCRELPGKVRGAVLVERHTRARQRRQDPGPQEPWQSPDEPLVRLAHGRQRERPVGERHLDEPDGVRLETPLTGLEVEAVDDVDRASPGTASPHQPPQHRDDRRLHLHQVPVLPAEVTKVPGQLEQGAWPQTSLRPQRVEGAAGVPRRQRFCPGVACSGEGDHVAPVLEHAPGLRALQRQASRDGGDGEGPGPSGVHASS